MHLNYAVMLANADRSSAVGSEVLTARAESTRFSPVMGRLARLTGVESGGQTSRDCKVSSVVSLIK